MRCKYEKRILLMATFAFLMDKQYKSANLKLGFKVLLL